MTVQHPFSLSKPFCSSAALAQPKTFGTTVKKFQDVPGRDGILNIEFPRVGERARNIISRSNTHSTASFPSMRMKRMIGCDSSHELNAYRLLESNPAVLEFSEQPCVIYYRLNGENHRHYPDSLVKTATTRALWEVKTSANARKFEIAERTRFLSEHLPAYGYQYSIVLAEDLSRQPRLKNVLLLLRYGRMTLSFEQKEHVRRLLSDRCFLRWDDVLNGRHDPLTLQQVCRLVLDNALHIDLDQILGSTTIIRKNSDAVLFGGIDV